MAVISFLSKTPGEKLINESDFVTETMTVDQQMPEIGIFEDHFEGHHLAYVETLVRYIFEKKKQRPLLLLSEEVQASQQYEIFLKPLESKFEVISLKPIKKMSSFLRFRRLAGVLKDLEKCGVRTLLIPTAGHLAHMAGIASFVGFRSKKIEIRCGLLRLGVAYPGRSRWRRLMHGLSFWLLQRAPMTIFYFDEYAVNVMRKKTGINLKTIPDPYYSSGIETSTLTSANNLSSSGSICFGCLGGLDRRKGADLLIDAFVKAKFKTKPSLLLAGQITDPTILSKVGVAQTMFGNERVVHLNKFLSNEDYFVALRKMDVVCLPYRRHIGPSGVFVQAASAGKVVIVSNYGWLSWEAKKYNKSRFFEEGQLDGLIEIMERIEIDFEKLVNVSGDYIPASQTKFGEILCGF